MELETWLSGYGLIEAPRFAPDGGLYFSDVTKGGVYFRAPDGAITTVIPRRRGVGGIALHADGGIVVSGRNICHVRSGESRPLFERPPGVVGFNDLTVDAMGRVLTGSLRSDPFSTDAERVPGECYRVEGEGEARQLYGGVGLSNGLGFSPDGSILYHADTAAGRILSHDVQPDGALSRPREFAALEAPDGLCVDARGAVWVASYGTGLVLRIHPSGGRTLRLAVPARLVSSVCLGGADLRDLVITTQDNTADPERGGTIFHTRVETPGLPPRFASV